MIRSLRLHLSHPSIRQNGQVSPFLSIISQMPAMTHAASVTYMSLFVHEVAVNGVSGNKHKQKRARDGSVELLSRAASKKNSKSSPSSRSPESCVCVYVRALCAERRESEFPAESGIGWRRRSCCRCCSSPSVKPMTSKTTDSHTQQKQLQTHTHSVDGEEKGCLVLVRIRVIRWRQSVQSEGKTVSAGVDARGWRQRQRDADSPHGQKITFTHTHSSLAHIFSSSDRHTRVRVCGSKSCVVCVCVLSSPTLTPSSTRICCCSSPSSPSHVTIQEQDLSFPSPWSADS